MIPQLLIILLEDGGVGVQLGVPTRRVRSITRGPKADRVTAQPVHANLLGSIVKSVRIADQLCLR